MSNILLFVDFHLIKIETIKLNESFFYHPLDVLSCWKHDHRSDDHPGDYKIIYKDKDNNNIDDNKNNIDTTGDGFGDTAIDPNENDGRADKFIASSDKFVEYQFTVNEVEPFTGFVIKIVMNGTDTARVPIIKNIRALALA